MFGQFSHFNLYFGGNLCYYNTDLTFVKMPLAENPESISTFADLAQYVGRRVSINKIWLDDSTHRYVADAQHPRIEGVLKISGKDFMVEPDGKDSTLSFIEERDGIFEARAPKLED